MLKIKNTMPLQMSGKMTDCDIIPLDTSSSPAYFASVMKTKIPFKFKMSKKRIRNLLIIMLSFMLLISIGYFDYFTGELGFFIFYFIPIVVLSWFLGKWTGMIMSIASSVVWLVSDHYCGIRYSNIAIAIWDTLVVRAGAFIIAAIAVAKLHESIEKQKTLSAELGKSLWYLKRIKDIMPMCNTCEKSKEENCYLKKVESAIKGHPESGPDCGTCPECISKNHPDQSAKIQQ